MASQTRERILDAALPLFLDQGVSKVTIDELRYSSGVSVGSFYHHFENKLDVEGQLYFSILEAHHQLFTKLIEDQPTTELGIKAMVKGYLRWVAQNPRQAEFMMSCHEPDFEDLYGDKETKINEQYYGFLFKWLRERASKDELLKLSNTVYYALWMGPAREYVRFWLFFTPPNKRTVKQLVKEDELLADAAWDCLRSRR